MKKLIFIFIFILLIPSRVFADYILETANCNLKKQKNCGAYLYKNKNGATYFCTLEEIEYVYCGLKNQRSEIKYIEVSSSSHNRVLENEV